LTACLTRKRVQGSSPAPVASITGRETRSTRAFLRRHGHQPPAESPARPPC
jgi:hypothetical protein